MSNLPTHKVFISYPAKKDGGKDFLQELAALWPTKDGSGFAGTARMAGSEFRIVVLPNREKNFDEKPVKNLVNTNHPTLDDEIPF